MQIQINTAPPVYAREQLADYVHGVVKSAVSHFSQQITHVEVHLTDEKGEKLGPNGKRCTMEVRVGSRHPIAVTHHASSLNLAVNGAAGKLKRSIEHHLQRLRDHRHDGA